MSSADLPAGTIFAVLRRAGVEPGRGSTDRRWRLRCPINPSAHKNGDKNASAWADAERNVLGCTVCGTLSAKQAAEHFSIDWKEILDETMGPRDGRLVLSPAPAPRRMVAVAPVRPIDAAALWDRCLPVTSDLELRRALIGRAIDAVLVEDRQHARALPSMALPSWARCHGKDWNGSGHRLILRMFDCAGALATLHARRFADGDSPKGLSPAGCSHIGAVFADPLARQILSTGTAPAWWMNRTILIAEGAPDFLTLGTFYGDADANVPAIFGVIAGSWTKAIADRIPDGISIVIRTHGDEAGEKYAATIAATFGSRCPLYRPIDPQSEEHGA